MKNTFWIFIFIVAILSYGCARKSNDCTIINPEGTTAKKINLSKVYSEDKIVKTPTIGTLSKVNVGDSMIATYKASMIPTFSLENAIIRNGKWCGKNISFKIPVGVLKLSMKNPEGRYFFNVDEYEMGMRPGLFIYNNKPSFASIVWYDNKTWFIEPKFKIDFNPKIIESIDDLKEHDFVRELIYTGKTGNTISILYREYANNMARPAFSLEVKYDLTNNKIIGFKNAKFEIIESDNLSIQFKALEHLK